MKKSVLLHVSPNMFPDINVNHATKKIWKELSKGFDEYHLFARSSDKKYHFYTEGNINLHLIPTFSKKARSFFLVSFLTIYFAKRYRVTQMIAQCPITTGLAVSLTSKLLKIPFMTEIHGMEYLNLMKRKDVIGHFSNLYLRFVFKSSHKLRSLSSKMTELIEELQIESNIVEIPNRVNFNIFNNPKNHFEITQPINITSVGRFVPEKGYELLIQSIIELSDDFNINLTLVGGGSLESRYISLIGDNKNINLIKWIPQEEFIDILHETDIYIQSSISEGMPRTILEAMAMRLPIISTNVGGILGVLEDEHNALIINPHSVNEIKSAIKELVSDEHKRVSIANNAFEDVREKYEWNNIFNLYREELKKMSY
ncbi:glycosyltransferase family 4 protein [Trichococcus flocculiformis]|uniref:glycosyltransferase family 4 protein n=1 Tax=Trichococcus flocculiformis TaxID=82803 RepID=UPI002AABA521|nr:glycosyltransferase family 4 protein [Trichococcus flocculiformis]